MGNPKNVENEVSMKALEDLYPQFEFVYPENNYILGEEQQLCSDQVAYDIRSQYSQFEFVDQSNGNLLIGANDNSVEIPIDAKFETQKHPEIILLNSIPGPVESSFNFSDLKFDDTVLGSPRGYIVVAGGIQLVENIWRPGNEAAERYISKLASTISHSPTLNVRKFGLEVFFQARFYLLITFLFEGERLYSNGQLLNASSVSSSLDKLYGIRGPETWPQALSAFAVYGTAATLTQAVVPEIINHNYFRNSTGFLGRQVESPFLRAYAGSFVGAPSRITYGYLLARKSLMTFGIPAAWYLHKQTLNTFDADHRLFKYNEDYATTTDYYDFRKSPFPYALMGFTLMGDAAFGPTMLLSNRAVSGAREHLIPSGLIVFLNQPEGYLTPEALESLSNRTKFLDQSLGTVSVALIEARDSTRGGIALSSFNEPGMLLSENTIEGGARIFMLEVLANSTTPDTDFNHVQWMKYHQLHMLGNLNSATQNIRSSFAKLASVATRIGDDPSKFEEYWEQRWNQAETPSQKASVITEMETFYNELRSVIVSTNQETQTASTNLKFAINFGFHDVVGGNYETHQIAQSNSLTQQLTYESNNISHIARKLNQIKSEIPELKTHNKGWFSWLRSLLPGREDTDLQSRYNTVKDSLIKMSGLVERSLDAYGMNMIPSGENSIQEITSRVPRLVEGTYDQNFERAHSRYSENLVRLSSQSLEIESMQEAVSIIGNPERANSVRSLSELRDTMIRSRERLYHQSEDGARKIKSLIEVRDGYSAELEIVRRINNYVPETAKEKHLLERIEELNDEINEIEYGKTTHKTLLKTLTELSNERNSLVLKLSGVGEEIHEGVEGRAEIEQRIAEIDKHIERIVYAIETDEQGQIVYQSKEPLYENVLGTWEKTSQGEKPLFIYDQINNKWKLRRLAELEKEIWDLREKIAKEDLSIQSAEVYGREFNTVQRKFNSIIISIDEIIKSLDDMEKEAKRNNATESDIAAIQEEKANWIKISEIIQSDTGEMKHLTLKRLGKIFDHPNLTFLKRLTSPKGRFRQARDVLIKTGRYGGGRVGGIAKFVLCTITNVGLGFGGAYGFERLGMQYLNNRRVPGTIDSDDEYKPVLIPASSK